MTTLDTLKLEHPEWCFTCGKYWLEPGGIHTCHESPLLVVLIAAKREDEARITQLGGTAESLFSQRLVPQLQAMIAELDKRAKFFTSLDHAWAVGMQEQNDSLLSQLTAEREAHAETKRQLEEVDAELVIACGYIPYRIRERYPKREAIVKSALARQASLNRPTDETPTDDRGEGEK